VSLATIEVESVPSLVEAVVPSVVVSPVPGLVVTGGMVVMPVFSVSLPSVPAVGLVVLALAWLPFVVVGSAVLAVPWLPASVEPSESPVLLSKSPWVT